MLLVLNGGSGQADWPARRSSDTSGDEHVGALVQQHRAVLEYENLVQQERWSEISTAYPEGPPECDCFVCRQLDQLSDRLVTLSRSVYRYEKQNGQLNHGLDDAMTELIDIIAGHHRNAGG